MTTTPEAAPHSTTARPQPWTATLLLGLSWIVFFGVMVWRQGALHRNPGDWLAGGVDPRITHLFGDITTADFLRGQIWRAVTAIFIHYSVLHLAVNLIVLYQLGRLIEPWYGSNQFLAICVVIGTLANIGSALVRPILGLSAVTQSGGGSGVLCGLIGVLAIVGWRSRDNRGEDMLPLMAFQLIFLGGMGLISTQVKNLVHAAGLVGGVIIGFLDPVLVGWSRKPVRWLIGAAGLGLVLASFGAQYQGNQDDARSHAELVTRIQATQEQLGLLTSLEKQYLAIVSIPTRQLEWPKRDLPARAALVKLAGRALDLNPISECMAPDDDRRHWIGLIQEPLSRRPDPGSIARFRTLSHRFQGQAILAIDQLGRRLRLVR